MMAQRLDKLSAELRAVKTPPLHEWHPRESLDINLRIDAAGRWYHQGSEIRRARLVKLFASVLRLEADGHYLITPRLKYPVAVDDAPFMAVESRLEGAGPAQLLRFRTNVDDWVTAGRAHPLRILDAAGRVSPRLEVRAGLQAKLSRAVYYELAEMVTPRAGDGVAAGAQNAGEENDDNESAGEILGIYSNGEFFPFGRT